MAARFATRIDGHSEVVWRLTRHPVGSLCLFRRVTGLRCPGCGMTRSVSLMAHGHPVLATRRNPLIWVLAALLVRPALFDDIASRVREWGGTR